MHAGNNTRVRECSAHSIGPNTVQSPDQAVPDVPQANSAIIGYTVPACRATGKATSTLAASITGVPQQQQQQQQDRVLQAALPRLSVGPQKGLVASSGRQLTIQGLFCKGRIGQEPDNINREQRSSDDAGRRAAGPPVATAVRPVATGPRVACDTRPCVAPRPSPGHDLAFESPSKKPALLGLPPAYDHQTAAAAVIAASPSMPTSSRPVYGQKNTPLDHQRPAFISHAAGSSSSIATAVASGQQSMVRGAAVSDLTKTNITPATSRIGVTAAVSLRAVEKATPQGLACAARAHLEEVIVISDDDTDSEEMTVSEAKEFNDSSGPQARPENKKISDDDADSEEVTVSEAMSFRVPSDPHACPGNKKMDIAADTPRPGIKTACETRRCTPDHVTECENTPGSRPFLALDRSETENSTERGDLSLREPICQRESANCSRMAEIAKLVGKSIEEPNIHDSHGLKPSQQPEEGCRLENETADEKSEAASCSAPSYSNKTNHEMECCVDSIQQGDVDVDLRKGGDSEKSEDLCGLPQDNDDDLMIPVELGTNSSLDKAKDTCGLLKDGEFLLKGQVCSFSKVYTIDKLCELHQEREKAQHELALAQDRMKSEFLKASRILPEKSDDEDTLTEEQQALADKMSLPVSVLRDRHPGCSFINDRLQQHLFSESTCHFCFDSPPLANDSELPDLPPSYNTPLGDYRCLKVALASGGLHTLLIFASDTSASLDYAFCLMSCHSDTRVVESIKNRILDFDQIRCIPPAAARAAKEWYPSAALVVGVLSNYGLDPKLAFVQDASLSATFNVLFKNADAVASAENVEVSSSDKPSGIPADVPWPTSQNVEAVLLVVRRVAETRKVYTDSEIETMVLSAVILAVDTRALEWDVNLEMSRFIAALLGALNQNSYQDKATVIASRLATLLSRCHHHTSLQAVEFFTLNANDAVPFCRQRLAYAILMQLLFGSMQLENLRHMKVGMLINIEKSLPLPVGFDKVDLYLTSTLLRLLWHSVPLWALDKTELADLHVIYTSLKQRERRIRSSLRSLDIMEIKHLIFLMTCMWSGVLRDFENQEALFYSRDVFDSAKRPVAGEGVIADDPCRELEADRLSEHDDKDTCATTSDSETE